MRKLNKKGFELGTTLLIALVIAAFILYLVLSGLGAKILKGIGILGEQIKQANESATSIIPLWEELTDKQKTELPPEKRVVSMFEAAERALREGQLSKDVAKLEKAKSLAQEILGVSGISEENKIKATDIIKAADSSIERIKAENLLNQGREMAAGGNKEGAIKAFEDCSKHTSPITASECFADKFFLINVVTADNLVGLAEKYKADAIKQVQTAGGDSKKKASVLYATGLIYEKGAFLFPNNAGEFLDKAIQNYNAVKIQYGNEEEFAGAAMLKIAMLHEDQYTKLGFSDDVGKSKAFSFYKELYNKFKRDLGSEEATVARKKIGELVDSGYADTLAVVTSLSGFVEDDDSLLTLDFGPELARFENILPDKANDLLNVKISDVSNTDYGMGIQYKITSTNVKSVEGGFDEVGEIPSDKDLWLYAQVKEPSTGIILCETRNAEEKKVLPEDIDNGEEVIKCGSYITFRGEDIQTWETEDIIIVKMNVIFNYFRTYKDKILAGGSATPSA